MTEIPVRRSLDASVEIASVDAVLDTLASWWAEVGDVAPRVRHGFETAVVEIAGNIVEHATGDATARRFRVELSADSRSLTATLVDDGEPLAIDPMTTTMAEVDDENGRGLALARAGVDRLDYSHDRGRNVWRLESGRG